MNIKITYHIMPWEIDYALLTFSQLKKSRYYLPEDVNITIDSVLNLSSFLINWEESKLPKEFFIEKYNTLSLLLKDYTHNPKIYQEDKLYGHLDLQRDCISSEVNYYINICPDMYFSEHLLTLLIESARQIKSKYFIITPETYKLWDNTWDVLTNKQYLDVPYNEWDQVDIFDIRDSLKNSSNEIILDPSNKSKWAGWFDLYNKEMFENLCPIQDDWKGYGPHDWYSLMVTEYAKSQGVDFQQYILRGQTIFEYSVGPLKNKGFSKYYKDLLKFNIIPNQREQFELKMQEYLQKGIQQLKIKNIL